MPFLAVNGSECKVEREVLLLLRRHGDGQILRRLRSAPVDESNRADEEDNAEGGGPGGATENLKRALTLRGGDDASVDHAKEGLTHDEAGGQEGTHTLGKLRAGLLRGPLIVESTQDGTDGDDDGQGGR